MGACADRWAVGRRTVVAGACAAALGAVAGCGGGRSADPDGPGGATDRSVPSGVLPPTALGVGSPGSRVGAASDVPVGGGRIYPGLEMVVTQPAEGVYVGLSAVCTHDFCLVGTVADGTIRCPCHGSLFRLDGTVAQGPATGPLPRRPVRVVAGEIVLV